MAEHTVAAWVRAGRPGSYSQWRKRKEEKIETEKTGFFGPQFFKALEKFTPEERQELPSFPFAPRPIAERIVSRREAEGVDLKAPAPIEAPRPFPGQEGGRDIITQPDGSTGFWSRDPVTEGAKWNQLTGTTTAQPSPAPAPREKRPAPNGVETFVNSQGQTMTWDGQKYTQTGFDPSQIFQPEPPGVSPFQQQTLDVQRR